MPWIFRFVDRSSEGPEELPDHDENEYGIGHDLHDTVGFRHEGKVFLHGCHVRTQSLKEQAGYGIHER